MKLGGWVLSGAVAARRILYFQFALVAVLAFGVTAITTYRETATTAGIRQTIAEATPAGRVTEVSTDLGPDAGSQTDAAAALFRRVFAGVAVDVDRWVTAGPFVVGPGSSPARTEIGFVAYDRLSDHARVLGGRWPPAADDGPVPLAMLDQTAAALHLAVGDIIDIDADTGLLTGQLTAVLAPLSATDPLLTDGRSGLVAMVDPGGLRLLSTAETVTWSISPDSTSFAAEQVRPLLAALGSLRQALNNDVWVNAGSVQQALPADRMPQVLPTAAGAFDPLAASRALAAGVGGLALPPGTRHLRVRLSVTAEPLRGDGSAATADPSVLTFVIWFADAQGRVVPAGAAAGWRIVAIDSISEGSSAAVFTVDVAGITATGGVGVSVPIDPKTVWAARPIELAVDGLDLTGRVAGRIGWTGAVPVSTGTLTVRLLPAVAGPAAVPVVVDSAVAQQLGLTVGAPLDLQLAATDRHIQARVAMISPVLPGPSGGRRVLADLGSVLTALLRTTTAIPAANQVWLTSGSTRLSSLAAAGVGGQGTTVTKVGAGTAAAVIRPVGVTFWAGAAAGVLLALLALATLATTLAGSRRGDGAVLTSLGLTARRQAVLRRRELLIAALLAAVLGTAEGAVTAELTVGGLARSAVIGSAGLAAHVVAASAGWLLLAAGLLGATVVVLLYGRRIRGQAEAGGTRAVTG